MKHLSSLILLFLLGSTLLVACGGQKATSTNLTPTPTSLPPEAQSLVKLAAEQTVEAAGYRYQAVAAWETKTIVNVTIMGPKDAAPETGPFFLLNLGTARDLELKNAPDPLVSSEALLEALLKSKQNGATKVSEKQEIVISGVEGFVATLESNDENGRPIVARVAAARISATKLFAMIGFASPPERMQAVLPEFQAVLDSVKFDVSPATLAAAAPTPVPQKELEEVRQWAIAAQASTEYGPTEGAASQTVGKPDTPGCGDYPTSWATKEGDTVDWLELTYQTPITPTGVNIFQNLGPSQVSKVELRDPNNQYHTIYAEPPLNKMATCPYTLSLTVKDATYLAQGVKVTIDQSVLGITWNEIDAVELVGVREKAVISPALPEVKKKEKEEVALPLGFIWRIGGAFSEQNALFAPPGGLTIDKQGQIYVAAGKNGVRVLDIEGHLQRTFGEGSLLSAADVALGANGSLYVADWGRNTIVVFRPDGTETLNLGKRGAGKGEFGPLSPQSIALDQNGTILALDENEDAQGRTYKRLLTFNASGSLKETLNLTDLKPEEQTETLTPTVSAKSKAANAKVLSQTLEFADISQKLSKGPIGGNFIALDAQGNRYLSDFTTDRIYKINRQGNLLAVLEVQGASLQALAVGPDNSLYVATGSKGIVHLNAQGEKLEQWCQDAKDVAAAERPLQIGECHQATGIALDNEGNILFTDSNLGFGYLTKFNFSN